MSEAQARRGVYLLPNLITTASLFAGFLGLLWSISGRFEAAALAVFFSALFDTLDGKVARLTNTTSEFGVQYDSLCDLAAFGIGPAVLLHQWQLEKFGRLGLAVCFLYAACGALRLARFNVQTAVSSKKYFTGLPIPAAAMTIASGVLFAKLLPASIKPDWTAWGVLALGSALAYLMVSKIRYFSLKEYGFLKAHPFSAMVTAVLVFALVASQPRLFCFILMIGYVLYGPLMTFVLFPNRHHKLLRDSPKESS